MLTAANIAAGWDRNMIRFLWRFVVARRKWTADPNSIALDATIVETFHSTTQTRHVGATGKVGDQSLKKTLETVDVCIYEMSSYLTERNVDLLMALENNDCGVLNTSEWFILSGAKNVSGNTAVQRDMAMKGGNHRNNWQMRSPFVFEHLPIRKSQK